MDDDRLFLPGARVVFWRAKHPETFHATYASSATVEAESNGNMYFQQMYRGMVGHGYENCTRSLRRIVDYVDNQLSSGPSNASAIKRLFFGPGVEYNTHKDFASALATIYDKFQGSGMAGGNSSLPGLCDYLDRIPKTEVLYALTKRFAPWPPFIGIINKYSQTNCGGQNSSLPLSCDLSQKRATDRALIPWAWMLCSEWGLGNGPAPEPYPIVSKYILPNDSKAGICNAQFPGATDARALPAQPETARLNQATGGGHVRPSNVFWTVGEFDPRRSITPLTGTGTVT